MIKLYIPSRPDDLPSPLVVMLHGCTQSADDFAAGTRMNFAAEKCGCFVVYPEQAQAANASKCWNWFRSDDLPSADPPRMRTIDLNVSAAGTNKALQGFATLTRMLDRVAVECHNETTAQAWSRGFFVHMKNVILLGRNALNVWRWLPQTSST